MISSVMYTWIQRFQTGVTQHALADSSYTTVRACSDGDLKLYLILTLTYIEEVQRML